MAELRGLRLDPQTIYILLIFVALFGVGYLVGDNVGAHRVQSQIVELGGQAQALTGTVDSPDKDGFTLKTSQGEWNVKYGKQGAPAAGPGTQGFKEGDRVQVSGTPIGKNTVVAQSVTKVVAPTAVPGPKSKK